MRIIIAEPSATTFDRTHAAKSVIGHSLSLMASGIDVVWFTNERSTLEYNAIPNYRIFPYTIYDDVRSGAILKNILPRGWRYPLLVKKTYFALLDGLRELNTMGEDHFFVPTADWVLLRAIQLLIENPQFRDQLPVFHILIMYENANWITGGYPYPKIIRLLRRLGSRVHLYTETKRHASSLAASLGRTVLPYPFPAHAETMRRDPQKNNYRVCFIGGGRRDKGFDLIPDIVRSFQEKVLAQDVTFTVQAPRPEDGLKQELTSLLRMDCVEVLDNQLNEAKYQECLDACSIMVFPYNQGVYRSRGSGIVSEAVAHGIPYICTEDTSLAEMLEEGSGKVAIGADEFAEAIADIVKNYDDYSRNAIQAALLYRKRLLKSVLIENVRGLAGADR